jgi:hypothetical protein
VIQIFSAKARPAHFIFIVQAGPIKSQERRRSRKIGGNDQEMWTIPSAGDVFRDVMAG